MKKIGTSSIFYEKYKPQCIDDLILPDELKNRLSVMAKNKDFPSIALFSSSPGCLLPGTRITTQSEPKWVNEKYIKEKYKLTGKQYNLLKTYCGLLKVGLNSTLIDENTITKNILIVIKNSKSGEVTYRNDIKYNNKHLKMDYWLSKLQDYYLAKEKVSILRHHVKYFENIENINKFYTHKFKEENLRETILKIQFKLIYSDFKNIKEVFPFIDSPLSVEFWTFRGFTKEESILKISDLQKHNMNKRIEKYTPEEMKKQRGFGQTLKKYIDTGLSEEDAKVALKNRQSTFTLEKCIKKYGVEEGTKIFDNRQERWQKTLNDKPQDEIDEINKLKGINKQRMIDKYGEEDGIFRYNRWLSSTNPGMLNRDPNLPGKLYYIHFFNSEIEFWKIGITSKQMNERFKFKRLKDKYGLDTKILFVNDCENYGEAFSQEQFILELFSNNRMAITLDTLKTTEAFDKDVLKDFYETI